MDTKLISTILGSLVFAACSGVEQNAEHQAQSNLVAPGGDQCAMITNQAYLDLRAVLIDGLAFAELDTAANGVNGNYAVAASGTRDSFALAIAALDAQYTLMQTNEVDSDPDTTNFVEGSLTGGTMWQIMERLQQAIHWGAISEIYHNSADAEAAVEQALLASELALTLQAHGQRCYMASYSVE